MLFLHSLFYGKGHANVGLDNTLKMRLSLLLIPCPSPPPRPAHSLAEPPAHTAIVARRVLRDSRHPCTRSTTFRLQTSKPGAEQYKIIQPPPFTDTGAAAKSSRPTLTAPTLKPEIARTLNIAIYISSFI